MTLVDLEGWHVASARPLKRPVSFWERLRMQAVKDAEAKSLEGPEWQALFMPDGRTLVAWGSSLGTDGRGRQTTRSLGIRLVDVDTGTVQAEASAPAPVTDVVPAPDGSAIYALTEADQPNADAADGRVVLGRLDPRNLRVTASRTLKARRTLMALASA